MTGFPLSLLTNQAENVSDSNSISLVQQADTRALLDMLNSLSNGDTLIAHVLSSDSSSFTVKTENNILINAKAGGSVSLKQGSTVLFEVNKFTGNTFTLRPLNINTNGVNTAKTAILEAGLPLNNRTMEMTGRLMEYSLPIDKASMQKAFSDISLNPDTPVKYIVDLTKLNIPVTNENLMAYEAYLNMENSVLDGFKGVAEEFSSYLSSIIPDEASNNIAQGAIDKAIELLKEIIYKDSPDKQEGFGRLKAEIINEAVSARESIDTFSDEASGKELSTGNFFSKEPTLKNEDTESLPGQKTKLFFEDKKAVKDILKSFIIKSFEDSLLLNEEKISSKNEVRNLYEKLFSETRHISEVFNRNELKNTPVGNAVSNLTNNVDFINSLNQIVPYLQIPFKNESGLHNGELYVFKNSRRISEPGSELTAFVHMDTDNLGATDVYIRLRDEHVTTQFCLEKEEYLDFIESNILFLSKRLSDKGFSLSVETKLNETPKSPIEVMLENTALKIPVVMTSFDARI